MENEAASRCVLHSLREITLSQLRTRLRFAPRDDEKWRTKRPHDVCCTHCVRSLCRSCAHGLRFAPRDDEKRGNEVASRCVLHSLREITLSQLAHMGYPLLLVMTKKGETKRPHEMWHSLREITSSQRRGGLLLLFSVISCYCFDMTNLPMPTRPLSSL